MQGAEHQMAGQRRADGDLRGFEVADFPDHDGVGILPQDGAQAVGEVEANGGTDLRLIDAVDQIFDGVFHRLEVQLRVFQKSECAVECGGFSASGRAGQQNDSVGHFENTVKVGQHIRLEADIGHVDQQGIAVEDSKDDFFAMRDRQHGDAHIDDAPVHLELKASVLR